MLWILLFSFTWKAPYWMLVFRLSFVCFACLTVFGIVEVWPRRLPRCIARWALQVFMVAVTVPITVITAYFLTLFSHDPQWWNDSGRVTAVFTFIFIGMIVGPWMAVAALLNQIRDAAQKQALQFQLEKSELERSALNARLNLLQAQVQPHFLFNTLANVRELIVMGSPRAATVLENLIAYLRASVPQMSEASSTIADEVERTRAYLDIMHMRMPDRLQYGFDVATEASLQPCPPVSILTLVENAVRHGIDPSESGGRIDVIVHMQEQSIMCEVRDTGVGFKTKSRAAASAGIGTGINSLQARLRMAFGESATVQLKENSPRGTIATIRWTVR
jgi:LytS/YehU family sensor histidine kinase